MKNNKKGFTLMEMLIVVAIIAVLVAIAIPVLSGALEKSREAADAANIRSAYAEVMVCALQGEAENGVTKGTDTDSNVTWSKTVKATQRQADWQNTQIENIGGLDIDQIDAATKDGTKKGWVILYNEGTGKCTITADALS